MAELPLQLGQIPNEGYNTYLGKIAYQGGSFGQRSSATASSTPYDLRNCAA